MKSKAVIKIAVTSISRQGDFLSEWRMRGTLQLINSHP